MELLLWLALSTVMDLHLPASTAEQQALIQKLASPSWQVREEATVALQKMDRSAILALQGGLQSHDLEVKRRCGRALDAILAAGPYPGWEGSFAVGEIKLPSGRTFRLREQTIRSYWERAGGLVDNEYIQQTDLRLKVATQLFAMDLFKMGYSRADIKYILEEIAGSDSEENRRQLSHCAG